MQNYGFIEEQPGDMDWELGAENSIKGDPLLPDRDWVKYKLPLEIQANTFFATFSCVAYGVVKAILLLINLKYGLKLDKAERFLSKMSGTVPNKGNSLQKVADTARTSGLVDQDVWPFTSKMTMTEYFKEIPQDIKNLGLEFLEEYQVNYEWVEKNIFWQGKFNQEKAWYALQFSPLVTAVDFSSPVREGLIQNVLSGYNHCEVIVGGVYGKKWITLNSYQNEIKEYAWDYNFYCPLRFDVIKLNQLTNEDMKMNLIRNSATGKIYLIDSDGTKHWIKDEKTFVSYFGDTAWKNREWLDAAPTEVDPLKEGEVISMDRSLLTAALRELLAKFGVKK